jgi:hypothetical protein
MIFVLLFKEIEVLESFGYKLVHEFVLLQSFLLAGLMLEVEYGLQLPLIARPGRDLLRDALEWLPNQLLFEALLVASLNVLKAKIRY